MGITSSLDVGLHCLSSVLSVTTTSYLLFILLIGLSYLDWFWPRLVNVQTFFVKHQLFYGHCGPSVRVDTCIFYYFFNLVVSLFSFSNSSSIFGLLIFNLSFL